MSTWISKAAFGCALAFLSACSETGGLNLDGAGLPQLVQPRPQNDKLSDHRVTVTSAKLELTTPDGYCIDSQNAKLGSNRAFMIFANCHALGKKSKTHTADTPAFLAVSVVRSKATQASSAEVQKLAQFLKTPKGRSAMSYSGKGDGFKIGNTLVNEQAVFVKIEDQGGSLPEGVHKRFWRVRVYKPSSGAIISATAFLPKNHQSSDKAVLALLKEFVEKN